jgi:hypothetical protein
VSTPRPVLVLLAACALGVGACGSSDSSSSTNAASHGANGPRNGPGAFLRDPKVQACLEKQGVTVPTFRRPQSGGGGQRPPGGGDGGRFGQRFEQLRAALEKCGVKLPQGGLQGRPPQQQSPGNSTTTQT